MNLVRKIKLSKIIPVSFSETELEIIDLLEVNLSNLVEFKTTEYTHQTYYMNKNGEMIFYRDFIYKEINFRHNLWEKLILLNVNKITIKYFLKLKLNMDVSSDIINNTSYTWITNSIEEMYKFENGCKKKQ